MDRRSFLRSLFSAPVIGVGLAGFAVTQSQAMPIGPTPEGLVRDGVLRPDDDIPEAEPTLLLGRSLHRMRRRAAYRRRYRRRRF